MKSKTIFQHIIDLIFPIQIPDLEDSQGFAFTKELNGLQVDNIWVANSLDNQKIKETIVRIKDGGEFALTQHLAAKFVKQVIDFGINTSSRKNFEDRESINIYQMFADLYDPNIQTLITFVPPDPKRLIKRGFHLPELLAMEFVKSLNNQSKGKKFYEIKSLFIKSQKTQRQTGLDREHRLLNLKGKIELKSIDHGKTGLPLQILQNTLGNVQSIFIIDDVCTTGATINECALQIKAAFPSIKVYGLAVASNL